MDRFNALHFVQYLLCARQYEVANTVHFIDEEPEEAER